MNDIAALEVDNLSYAFGKKTVLDRVGFVVRRGECTILLGPNGAGKSTLFALITRLYDSRDGTIRINGFDVKKNTLKALAQMGVVFQQATLDLDLSVLQNLRYHADLQGLARGQARVRIEEELQRQGMLERRHEKVRELNGGHRRRVEVARALLHQPSLLLLDEPTVGLDVPSRNALVKYLHELSEINNIAVFWASHLIDEIGPNDQLVVLHQGVIRASGGIEQVLTTSGTSSVAEAFNQLTETRTPKICK